jgi:hypothetical protein
MSFNFSPKIVTDGLILYLDAANTKSYVSGSTTWNDISRSETNVTLVNGPTFSSGNGGSIVFDGIDNRVSRTTNINTGQNFTVNAWIYPALLGATRRAVIGNSYSYAGRQGWLFCTGSINNTFFMSIGADQSYRVAAANTLSLNVWQYITAVVTDGGLTITLYVNGQTINTSIVVLNSGTITYTYPQFNVGFRDVGAQQDPFTGCIAQVSIYNRALSQQEIRQNYNATKKRYQL